MSADAKLLADMDALVAWMTDKTDTIPMPEVCDIPGTMRRAADALRRYVQGEAWVSVDERLPEKDGPKVVAYGDNTECDFCGSGCMWDAKAEAFHSKPWLAQYKVTHWRSMIDTPARISLPRP